MTSLIKPANRLITRAWLILALGLAGCAINRETADITPGADLSAVHSLYVVKFGPDNGGVNKLIADRLVAMGYAASTGLETEQPSDVDAVVTYRDKWMWDLTMYMLELDVTMRNPKTKFPMAVGNSYHTSLTRKSPEEMVKEVLTNILKKAKGGGG
jgi:hypothetical protein